MKPNRVMLLVLALLGVTLVQNAEAFYNPSNGRWLSRDPIEERGGANLHTFVRNDPASVVDFLGLFDAPVIIFPKPEIPPAPPQPSPNQPDEPPIVPPVPGGVDVKPGSCECWCGTRAVRQPE